MPVQRTGHLYLVIMILGVFKKLVIFNPDRFIDINNIGATEDNITSRYAHLQWDIISEHMNSDINSIDSGFKLYSKSTATAKPVYNSIHQTVSDQIDGLLENKYDWNNIGYEKPS